MDKAPHPSIERVFVCHHAEDRDRAAQLVRELEAAGIPCWIASRDVAPGASWGNAIADAASTSRAVVLILSAYAAASPSILAEVQFASVAGATIIPFALGEYALSPQLASLLADVDGIDASRLGFERAMQDLIRSLCGLLRLPNVAVPSRRPDAGRHPLSKGYVFISYVRSDADFVDRLRSVLESSEYGYWDYVVGDRDYHGILYRELEERIDGASAFMTIVSDDWRRSDWVASEFIYAREARIPIFVIQAKSLKRPLPILLNLQTRIDMSTDFERGARTLAEELAKKGL